MDKTGNINEGSLEPTPVFEADNSPKAPKPSEPKSNKDISPQNLQEETPDELTVTDIGGVDESAEIPAIDEAAFNEDEGGKKKKFIIIIGGIIAFVLVFAVILTVLFRLRGKSAAC